MPAPVQDVVLMPTVDVIQFSLEPAYNSFHSLALLSKSPKISGLGEWISKTFTVMTAEERERHRLVMHGLFYAAQPLETWSTFGDYIEHLKTLEAESFQDKLLDAYAQCIVQRGGSEITDYEKRNVLADFDSYLEFLDRCFEAKHIDPEFEAEAFAYIQDPQALKDVIVNHLGHMWAKYLRNEWRRVQPLLEESVQAFRQVDYGDMDNSEIFEFVTTRKIPDESWEDVIRDAERITFIPSAHIGPYVGQIEMNEGIAIIFGARMPQGAGDMAPDLSRAEILVRLGALADDTRLQILRAISEHGEMRSQDIMQVLDLSQSAASRHLSQLNATGYVTARRCEGAKCYQLNIERIEDTLTAVSAYLSAS